MGHPIHKHMSGQRYDAKKAYDKDLTDSARLHYLENSEHDKSVSRKSSSPLDARPTVKPVEKPGEVATKRADEKKYIPELDHGAVSRKSSSPLNSSWGDGEFDPYGDSDPFDTSDGQRNPGTFITSHPDYDPTPQDKSRHYPEGISRKSSSPLNTEGNKCPASGCVQPHDGKWGVVSGKTGKFWDATYQSESSAEAGLRGYFANK